MFTLPKNSEKCKANIIKCLKKYIGFTYSIIQENSLESHIYVIHFKHAIVNEINTCILTTLYVQ